MSINAVLSTLFLSVSIVLSLVATLNNNLVSAQSQPPPFAREEILDNDAGLKLESVSEDVRLQNKRVPIEFKNGTTIFGKVTDDRSQCTLENFDLPSIDSVSFVSDEKTLNSTLWLNQSFLEPPYNQIGDSPFQDVSEIHPVFLSLYVFGTENKSLQKKDQEIIEEIKRYNTNITWYNSSNVKVTIPDYEEVTIPDYEEAINRTYTGVSNSLRGVFGKSYYTQMNIIIEKDNTFYKFEYKAEKGHFDEHKDEVREMINSFYFNNATGSSEHNEEQIDNYAIYHDPSRGIPIRYPSNWTWEAKLIGNDVVTFFPTMQGVYLNYVHYGVKLFPKTIFGNTQESVQGYIQKIYWDSNKQKWMEFLNDMSSNRAERNIYEEDAYDDGKIPHIEGQRWVQVPIRLKAINSPTDYSAYFFMSIKFVKDGNICQFGETTNAISSPSPPFKIIYNPEGPISIGPTETKYIEVEIVPTANLFSKVTLHIGELPEGIENATFIETDSGIITSRNTTKTLEITPYGSNTAQLEIKGPPMYNPIRNVNPFILLDPSIWRDNPSHPVTVNITAVTKPSIFPNLILPRSDALPLPDITPSQIPVSSTLRLNVLNIYESVLDKFSALNASGAVDIVIAIGGAISGFVVGVIAKTKRH